MLSSEFKLVHCYTSLCKINHCCRNLLVLELLANVKIVNYAKTEEEILLVIDVQKKVKGLCIPSCFLLWIQTGSNEKVLKK